MNNLNSIDFSNVGNSVTKDTNAFKKIQRFSKVTTNNITQDSLSDSQVFAKINNLYNNTSLIDNKSYSYGSLRQHNHASLNSFLPSFVTLVDKTGLDKFCEYSLNVSENQISGRVLSDLLNITSIHNNNIESKVNVNGQNIASLQSFLNTTSSNGRYFDSFFFK
jgi:hypothetical protein